MLWLIALCATVVQCAQLPVLIQLTPAQQGQCVGVGLINSTVDCCHFILCEEPRGDSERGWDFACPSGTSWSSNDCACTEHALSGCTDPCIGNQAIYTPAPCPLDLDPEEECCLIGTGQVFVRNNATTYTYRDEVAMQWCPPGQNFVVDTCCCEGFVQTDGPKLCHNFNFEDGIHDIIQNTKATELLTNIVENHPLLDLLIPPFSNTKTIRFQESAQMSVPYFSAAWWGDKLTVGFWFKMTEVADSVIFHNGDVDGIGASIRVELIDCSGDMFLVAGVMGCDRVEDTIVQLTGGTAPFAVDEWLHVTLVYNMGNILVRVVNDDAGMSPVVMAQVEEEDELVISDIQKILNQANGRAQTAASDAQSDVTTWRDESDRSADEQISAQTVIDCLVEIQTTLSNYGVYTDGTGLESFEGFKQIKKDLRAFRKQCKRTRRGGLPDPDEHQTALDSFNAELAKIRSIVQTLCDAFQKMCDLEDNTPVFNSLPRDIKNKLRRLKRRIRKVKAGMTVEDPTDKKTGGRFNQNRFDKWVEQCEDCIARANRVRNARSVENEVFRVKRDDDNPGPNNIQQTKYQLIIGEDFQGSMDEVLICVFAYSAINISDLEEGGDVTNSPDF